MHTPTHVHSPKLPTHSHTVPPHPHTCVSLPQSDSFARTSELPEPNGAVRRIESAQMLAKEVQREREREGIQEPVVVDAHDPKQLHGGQGQRDVVAGVVEQLPQRGGIANVAGVLAWIRRTAAEL